ncbi:hypothetical protein FQN60_012630 [Etheostoma spectabile]|uniref:Uncharacterized protein n=1 Tax=Etheostoma spectabile TaxID=54343 RepID=A0A5J5D9R6_9PERO|nr:hypothetical protein FQN60_012630 [Etheostoma spectabile]
MALELNWLGSRKEYGALVGGRNARAFSEWLNRESAADMGSPFKWSVSPRLPVPPLSLRPNPQETAKLPFLAFFVLYYHDAQRASLGNGLQPGLNHTLSSDSNKEVTLM